MTNASMKPDYRIVALDMDGTLLNSAKEITPYTRDVLRRATESGAVIALSTGRCLSELRRFLKQVPEIACIIGESGAYVLDVKGDHLVQRIVFDDGDVERIFEAADDIDCFKQCFIDGQSCISSISEEMLKRCGVDSFTDEYRLSADVEPDLRGMCRNHPRAVGKINFFFSNGNDRLRLVQRIRSLDITMSDSMSMGVEISPGRATKAGGLKALCRYLDIPLEQTMAVGDGANDVDILHIAGLSVVMGNAADEIRALAQYVTDDCDHDGAAHAIERFIL